MIIQAKDGNFYIDPCFELPNAKFFCEDGQMIVAVTYEYIEGRGSFTAACRKLGIKCEQTLPPEPSDGVFAGAFMRCVNYAVKLKSPIPVPTQHAGKSEYPQSIDGLICWSLEVHPREILKIMEGQTIPIMIHNFLGGGDLKGKIRRQVPLLVGAKITEQNRAYYFKKLCELGSTITLKRRDPLDTHVAV